MGALVEYNPRTVCYELKNSKEVFVRVEYEHVVEWCKENGFSDWFTAEEYAPIPKLYVDLFFAQLVFNELDLEQMTDAHVVRSCIRRFLTE